MGPIWDEGEIRQRLELDTQWMIILSKPSINISLVILNTMQNVWFTAMTWKWCVLINETCLEQQMSLSFWGFLGLLLLVWDLSCDPRQLIYLWSYVDRNFSRISICSMGMWQPGIFWSNVILPQSSVDWAWLMKSTPKGPSPLLASYLSSGLPQKGFCWDQLASKETCTICFYNLDFSFFLT